MQASAGWTFPLEKGVCSTGRPYDFLDITFALSACFQESTKHVDTSLLSFINLSK